MTDDDPQFRNPTRPRRMSRSTIALYAFVVLEAMALSVIVWAMLGRGTSQ